MSQDKAGSRVEVRTRFYTDTEFIARRVDGVAVLDLISIGVVSDVGGDTFYAENSECDLTKASPWVRENVFPHLIMLKGDPSSQQFRETVMPRDQIATKLLEFVGDSRPEFWLYFGAYDWFAVCQVLFDGLINLPKSWASVPRDIKNWADDVGNPRLPRRSPTVHNALTDALWTKQAYKFLAGFGALTMHVTEEERRLVERHRLSKHEVACDRQSPKLRA